MVSLALDICNDLGIAVPITCFIDNVAFRAYRYGEDAPFGDSELRLAYETVNGYMLSSGKTSLPHLILEKLLVFMLRSGVANGFLKPFFGQSGTDGTVRVGFYLKGAVTVISRGPRDRSDRDIWLSQYLCERGVLTSSPSGLYELADVPDSDGNTKLALNQAKQIGLILGHCVRSSDGIHDAAPLDMQSLIVLMTCCTPHHTAAAVEVELDIFRRWYEAQRNRLLLGVRSNSPESLSKILSDLLSSHGYEAVHSGLLKYRAFKNDRTKLIISECKDYLVTADPSSVLSDIWEAAWDAISGQQAIDQENSFGGLIDEAATLLAEIGISLVSLEVSLIIAIKNTSNVNGGKRLRNALAKLRSFSETAKMLPNVPSYSHKMCQMLDMQQGELDSLRVNEMTAACLKSLDSTIQRSQFLVERMEPIIEMYGRVQGLHYYKYFIYYDIVDSTATYTDNEVQSSEEYRRKINLLKIAINKAMHQLGIIARKNRGEVYCTMGDSNSLNDCKHIFISGKFGLRHAEDCVARLLTLARDYAGLYLRIYVLPCNFVGSDVFRYQNGHEVNGPRFWEHFSRLLKAGKIYETNVGRKSSFVLLGTDALIGNFRVADCEWNRSEELIIETEIEKAVRKVAISYGAIGNALGTVKIDVLSELVN
jgi:hypothetical protein